MITKMCRRCKKLIIYPETYCNKCKPLIINQNLESKQINTKIYNKSRDKKYKRFYASVPWILLSAKVLQDNVRDHKGKCKTCTKLAIETDHIIPIQTEEGWPLRLEYKNCQPLCIRCHNKKHNRFGGR